MLPQLIILTAMSVALWLAARWVKLEVERVETEMRRAQELAGSRPQASGCSACRLDPEPGGTIPSRQ